MRGCSGDRSGDSGDKQMAALQTNIIHLHWRCCHCPVQKYHFIEGSQWILIVTRWSQDNMCWYDPKPTNKRLLQRSTSLIHRFYNWGGGCIQGKVNNSLFSLMMTCTMCTMNLFDQNSYLNHSRGVVKQFFLCVLVLSTFHPGFFKLSQSFFDSNQITWWFQRFKGAGLDCC